MNTCSLHYQTIFVVTIMNFVGRLRCHDFSQTNTQSIVLRIRLFKLKMCACFLLWHSKSVVLLISLCVPDLMSAINISPLCHKEVKISVYHESCDSHLRTIKVICKKIDANLCTKKRRTRSQHQGIYFLGFSCGVVLKKGWKGSQ